MSLEKKFDEDLNKKCQIAEREYGCKLTRFLQTVEKFGGVKTAKEIIRKGRVSDCFDKLQQVNRMDLTMEATIIDKKYGDLFNDDEVNYCYDLLCEYGYYN